MKANPDKIKNDILDRYKKCISDMEFLGVRRQKASRYYRGEVDFKSAKGLSQRTTNDVSDTIEWLMPFPMRVFYGSDKIVSVKPTGAEDEFGCKLLENKMTHDVSQRNNGFRLHYDWFKDALIFDLGIVKYCWKNDVEYIHKEYNGLTEQEIQILKANPNFVIESIETTQPGQYNEFGFMMSPTLYRLIGKKVRKSSHSSFENLPPDEYVFDLRMRSKTEPGGIHVHKKLLHVKELEKYGLTKRDMESEIKNFSDSTLFQERYADLGGLGFLTPNEDDDYFYIHEAYHYEYDKEYGFVPMLSTIIGNKIKKYEVNKYGEPPFCLLSPILAPHRMLGLSFMNFLMNTQETRTTFLQNILNNMYFANYGRTIINPHRVVESEFENNVPGSNIRTRGDYDPSSAVHTITPSTLPKEVYHMFEEILPEMRTDATGVTKHDQEFTSKTAYKTASGISQVMSAMQQRKELLARIFAETGVKDLYKACARMNVNFMDKEENIKIDKDWVVIKPEDIDVAYDIEIDVGLSTGSKEIAFQDITTMLNTYGMVADKLGPATFELFGIDEIREIIKELWQNKGYKNTSRFVKKEGMNGQQPIPGQGMAGQGVPTPAKPPNYQGVFRGNGAGLIGAMEGNRLPGQESNN